METQAQPQADEVQELNEALVRSAQGDKDAFKTVYRLTSGPLFSVIRNIVRDEDVAKDILQKGYLSVWQNAGRFDAQKGRAFTWILVIMRNQAIDEIRRMSRFASTSGLHDDILDTSTQPDIETETSLVSTVLRDQLERLPPRMALVIREKFIHGKSCQEIADEMATSANTVRSWLRRGLLKMRDGMPVDRLDLAITPH